MFHSTGLTYMFEAGGSSTSGIALILLFRNHLTDGPGWNHQGYEG